MKLAHDAVRCEGHGTCEALDPDRFSLDDDDQLHIARHDVLDDEVELINRVVVGCPRRALRLEP